MKSINLEGLKISFSEPLFIISIITFLVAILKFINFPSEIFNIPYVVTVIAIILTIASLYFSYAYFKKTNNHFLFGVPLLIFLLFLFSYYSEYYGTLWGTWAKGDFTVFSAIVGIWIFLYTLSLHKFLSKESAGIIAIFFSMLIIHLLGATHPYLISGDAFDSHWHYKIMNNTYTNEHVIDHDYLVYPAGKSITYIGDKNFVKKEDGLDFSSSQFLHAVFVASIAKILSPLNFNQYDIAMLFGGIMAGFTAILIFLFLREIFYDFRPYNKLVGLIGAFGLTFSYGYASRAIAGSCEASEMGLMFLAGSLFLVFLAYRKKSLKYTIIAGISAFFFSLAWAGAFAYFVNGIGLFVVIFALIKLLHKENCFSHVPYFVIPLIFTLFHGIVHHAHNTFPNFNVLETVPTITLVVISASILIPLFFELIRNLLIKLEKIKTINEEFGTSIIEKFNRYIQQKIYALPKNTLLSIVGATFVLGICIVFLTPALQLVISALTVERSGVVFKTIAEQIGRGDFKNYGVLFVYTFITIPLLFYYAVVKRSYGAVVVLCFGIPALWGYYNVPQLLFDTSLSVIALGSTVGLIAGINKKDINGLRIIGTILVLLIPLIILPIIIDGTSQYTQDPQDPTRTIYHPLAYFSTLTHPGIILHEGEGGMDIGAGIMWWMPGLQWFKENTNKDDIILTWWDYGHWITSISERPVLIDNLQAVHWQLQDVARFFTYYETEEEAMKLVEEYPKIKYIVLDYTLIGKNHALHFIGNGNLTREGEKSYEEWLRNDENPNRKALSICQFSGRQESYETTNVGTELVTKLFFWCSYPPNKTQRTEYLASIEFDVGESSASENPNEIQKYIKKIIVRGWTDKTRYDSRYGEIPVPTEEMTWNEWKKEHNGSLLGIQSFGDVINCVMKKDVSGTICQFPMFREFVYAPNEFQNHMFTKLYLGEHAESFARVGLCDTEWCKNETKRLKNWVFVWDNSPYNIPVGYLRIWKLAKACTSDSECSNDQYCENMHCLDKKKENEFCNKSSECISGICENGKCRTKHLRETGENCARNEECKSNACVNGKCAEFSPEIYDELKKFETKKSIIPICMKETIEENDKVRFYNCYKNKLKEGEVNNDYNLGKSMGVGGTPTFITGCDKKEMENLCSKLSDENKEACKIRLIDHVKHDESLECKRNGKILIYEFTDLQCPFCYRAEPLVNELRKRDDVIMEVHFFLIHPNAHNEHIAIKCAEEFGKFDEFKKCAFDAHFINGINEV